MSRQSIPMGSIPFAILLLFSSSSISLTNASPIPPNSSSNDRPDNVDSLSPSSSSSSSSSSNNHNYTHNGAQIAAGIVSIFVLFSIIIGGLWYLRRRGRMNREVLERGEMDGGKGWPEERVGGKGVNLNLGLGKVMRGDRKGDREWRKGGKWEELK